MSALALLPEVDVRLGLENLKELVDEMLSRAVQPLEYFETVYIVTEGSQPRFPPSTWNVRLQTLRREHRTNNLCGD